jgi:hypothetical protein
MSDELAQLVGSCTVRTHREDLDVVFTLVPTGAPADFQGDVLARVPVALLEADPLREVGKRASSGKQRPRLYHDLTDAFFALISRLNQKAGIELLGGTTETDIPQPLKRRERRALERRGLRAVNGSGNGENGGHS